MSNYKSKLEQRFAAWLKKRGLPFSYEAVKIPYTQPQMEKKYTPDFIMNPASGARVKNKLTLEELRSSIDLVVLETKGNFSSPQERRKVVNILNSNPWLRDRFFMIFPRDNFITSKRKKKDPEAGMKYSDFCRKNGINYFIGEELPREFFRRGR